MEKGALLNDIDIKVCSWAADEVCMHFLFRAVAQLELQAARLSSCVLSGLKLRLRL